MNPGIATKQGYVLTKFLTGTGENPVPIVGEIDYTTILLSNIVC